MLELGGLNYCPYRTFEDRLYHTHSDGSDKSDQCTLYFMSILMRRKHYKAKRDCSTFVLAFASRNREVQSFKHIILSYLQYIFDQTNVPNMQAEAEQQIIENVIKELYTFVNKDKISALTPRGNFI